MAGYDHQEERAELEDALLREAGEVAAVDVAIVTDNVRWNLLGSPRSVAKAGRYVALSRIGEGGTGLVYDAYDPLLDRRVALKFLQVGGRDPEAAAKGLLANARGMAKLRHPNAIRIHDAGISEGGAVLDPNTVYVVMERVDGERLDRWLTSTRRTSEEILLVFRDVGAALAAAHELGIVHRDVKPQNILVRGDGSAVVFDFAILPPPEAGFGPLEVGTHGFMAPEMEADGSCSPAADQYSFCVSLARAFQRESGGEAFDTQTLKLAGFSGPRWLRSILRRGLSHAPEDRFPDMRALLARLDRRRRRTTVAVAGGGAVFLGLAALGVFLRPSGPSAEDECRASAEELEVGWDDEDRDQLHRAFGTEGLDGAWVALEQRLDAQVEDWRGRWMAQCLDATSTACLEREVWQLEAFVDVLKTADANMLAHSPYAAITLAATPLDCDMPTQVDVAAIADLERELSTGWILSELDAQDGALERASTVLAGAERLGDPDLAARARLLTARALVRKERDYRRAAELLLDVLIYAEGHDLPALRVDALTTRVHLHARLAHGREAEHDHAIAAALLERMDDQGSARTERLTLAIVTARLQTGDLDGAGDALASLDSAANEGVAGVDRVAWQTSSARLLAERGEFEDALREYQRAHATAVDVGGELYPALTRIEVNMAMIYYQLHRFEEAEAVLADGEARCRALGTEDRPSFARVLAGRVRLALVRDDRDAAEAYAAQAASIFRRSLPENHPELIGLQQNLALSRVLGNDPELIETGQETLITLTDQVLAAGPDPDFGPQLPLDLRFATSFALKIHGRHREARRYVEGLTESLRSRRGADTHEMWVVTMIESEILWQTGDRERARRLLLGEVFEIGHPEEFTVAQYRVFLALAEHGPGSHLEAELEAAGAALPNDEQRAMLAAYLAQLQADPATL